MTAPAPPRRPVRPAPRALSLIALPLLLGAAPAGAADLEGDHPGVLVPLGATGVRLDREQLSFSLAPDLRSAAVTAAYHLTNGGAAPESVDVALVSLRAAPDEGYSAARIALEVDGAPRRFHVATAADLLAPTVRAWLSAHPEVDRALAASSSGGPDPAPIRPLVEAAGGRCNAGCAGLVTWYRSTHSEEEHHLSGADEDAALVDAARDVTPEAVATMATGWPVDPRLAFVLFNVELLPGQTRSVTVHDQQRSEVDRQAYVNDTRSFDYRLAPATRWAGFGPVEVAVRVPGRARFTSPLPFRREGDAYRLDLAGLAALDARSEGELRFQAMSLDGLWFGMMARDGYWAILASALAATAFAAGGAVARHQPGAPWWKRAAWPVIGGALAAACNLAVLVLLLDAFPVNALGAGYDGIARGALLVALSVPAGALASVVWGAYRYRRVE